MEVIYATNFSEKCEKALVSIIQRFSASIKKTLSLQGTRS